jgi:5'(3')-deoxyribonucleotidase
MRIGFDCDGILYNWHDSVRKHLGLTEEQAPNPTEWHFHESWGLTGEQFGQAVIAGIEAGVIFAYGEPMPGSVEAFKRLRDAGHTIHIVTDCGSFGPPGVAQGARIKWLQDHGLHFDTITFGKNKAVVDLDFFLDDKPENVEMMRARGTSAYLLDQGWNQKYDAGFTRVYSLEEYVDLIIEDPNDEDDPSCPIEVIS